jgi:membrane dipeptidase
MLGARVTGDLWSELKRGPIWDNHACPPMDMQANLAFMPQIERYRAAGASVLSLNVGYGEMSLEEHLRLLAQMRRWVLDRPDRYRLIGSVEDVAAARAAGQLGIAFDIEGAAPLGDQIDLVDAFYALGVRWISIAYNRANAFGSGCHEAFDTGLTATGRKLVERMAEVGMVLCLSHAGYRTAREAIETAPGPVVFTHSNALALQDHPRNIPDDLIRACAAKGGVVGVNGLALFLGGPPSTEAFVEHLDHMVQLVGPAHVGLGTDYVFDLPGLEEEKASMASTFPVGSGYEQPVACLAPEMLPQIAEALDQRGYGFDDIAAIFGGNWLRVARACWR